MLARPHSIIRTAFSLTLGVFSNFLRCLGEARPPFDVRQPMLVGEAGRVKSVSHDAYLGERSLPGRGFVTLRISHIRPKEAESGAAEQRSKRADPGFLEETH